MWTKFKEFAHYADLATFNSLVFLYNVGIKSSSIILLLLSFYDSSYTMALLLRCEVEKADVS
jgi:hypothetical protein